MQTKSTTSSAELTSNPGEANAASLEESETDVAAEAGTDGPTSLSKDTVFELLKNQRRRNALTFLREEEGETTLSDMAEHIAAKENGIDVQALTSSQRKRVYIGLYQCHLPKMASAGVVEFDKNRGTIRLMPEADQLEQFLAPATPTEETPSKLPLLVAAGIGLATAAGVVGVPAFSALPAAAWAILSASALVALAVTEAYGFGVGAD
jgi:hypothetical protein